MRAKVKGVETYDDNDWNPNHHSEHKISGKYNNRVFPASPPAGPLLLDFRIRLCCWPELRLRCFVVGKGGGGGVNARYRDDRRRSFSHELGRGLVVVLVESIKQDHGKKDYELGGMRRGPKGGRGEPEEEERDSLA